MQSEDVMEHIEYDKLKETINEIYRVLKPEVYSDYQCLIIDDILYNRSVKDKNGNIVFDEGWWQLGCKK